MVVIDNSCIVTVEEVVAVGTRVFLVEEQKNIRFKWFNNNNIHSRRTCVIIVSKRIIYNN